MPFTTVSLASVRRCPRSYAALAARERASSIRPQRFVPADSSYGMATRLARIQATRDLRATHAQIAAPAVAIVSGQKQGS